MLPSYNARKGGIPLSISRCDVEVVVFVEDVDRLIGPLEEGAEGKVGALQGGTETRRHIMNGGEINSGGEAITKTDDRRPCANAF